jgi:Outer membrane protein beta-barrel family
VQNSNLESQRIYPKASAVNQSFFNFLPNANYRKKIGLYSNVRMFYRASTVFPSINQLQDVVNLNNPLRVSSGNPDLKPSYTHFLSTRYSYTNTKNSRSFFANLVLQTANDNIVNATFKATKDSLIQQNNKLDSGSLFSKPINLDGYQNLNTFFTFSTPIKLIKSTVNINTGFNYSKYPGFTSNKITFTNSYGYNIGVVIGSNISEYIDFNVSYSANWTESKTNTTNSSSSKFLNQSTGAQLNLLSKKGGWFLQNDVSGNINSGLSTGFNSKFWLWNVAAGKKIFKKSTGEIKLSVFDLLKQNQSIARNITGSYIQDVQTQVLKQFFMLTFTYKLKNFGTPAKQPTNERENRRQRGDGFGGQQGGSNVPGF